MDKGNIDTSSHFTTVYSEGISYILNPNSKTKEYIDYNRELTVNIIEFDGIAYKTIEPFDSLYKAKYTDDSEKILGYKCKKATYKAFSNTIEVWFTNKAKAKGSPYKSYLPKDALVLKVMINGGRTIIATDIKKLSNTNSPNYQFNEAKTITKAEYREMLIKARYSIIPIFNKQQINFESDIINPPFDLLDTVYRFERGNIILKKIKLTEDIKNGAYVFATVNEWSNGDAYDRLGSIFIAVPNDKGTIVDVLFKNNKLSNIQKDSIKKYYGFITTENYTTPTELVRFITPFG